MASKAVRECFAAPIALAKAVKTGYAIAVDEANGPIAMQVQRDCHDTLPWLISVSLAL